MNMNSSSRTWHLWCTAPYGLIPSAYGGTRTNGLRSSSIFSQTLASKSHQFLLSGIRVRRDRLHHRTLCWHLPMNLFSLLEKASLSSGNPGGQMSLSTLRFLHTERYIRLNVLLH